MARAVRTKTKTLRWGIHDASRRIHSSVAAVPLQERDNRQDLVFVKLLVAVPVFHDSKNASFSSSTYPTRVLMSFGENASYRMLTLRWRIRRNPITNDSLSRLSLDFRLGSFPELNLHIGYLGSIDLWASGLLGFCYAQSLRRYHGFQVGISGILVLIYRGDSLRSL